MTNSEVKRLARENGESATLFLDKFVDTNSKNKSAELKRVCELSQRKNTPLSLKGDIEFQMKLNGRMIVNHSGGILENAGLCLHKFFNYPMIPGSALKGITRHYARAIKADDADVQRIFGDDSLGENVSGGTVAFLAAVPADNNWKLAPDILAPHKDDWHNPVPIPFIAVEKGAAFQFALKKTSRGSNADLKLTAQWLKEALAEHGVGGKTTSGYGRFEGANSGLNAVLKLVTPGFFGGADPFSGECTGLRISSLRGMLRYWWRIAMTDVLSKDMHKKLENLLWGSTDRAGLIRLSVTNAKETKSLFNYKDKSNVEINFANRHGIDSSKSGLHYLAYGMNELSRGEKRQRYYVEAGSTWTLNMAVRESGLVNGLNSDDVKNQALLALSLLCRFGGLGSKSRKGFGSLHWSDAWDLKKCREVARQFAGKIKRQENINANAPYSFGKVIQATIDIPVSDAWLAIDKLGLAVQLFASSQKHNPEKAALGLPKQIHGPSQTPLRHQSRATHRQPLQLRRDLERFAAPVWYHFEPSGNGLKLNILAFPSKEVEQEYTSQNILSNLVESLKQTLRPGFFIRATKASPASGNHDRKMSQIFQNQVGDLKAGTKVTGILLEEKTKKGGWKVRNDQLGVGSIQNSGEVPHDKKSGDSVNLEVKIAKVGAAQFKWLP